MASFSRVAAVTAALAGTSVQAAGVSAELAVTANPIRRVVTMIQNIEKKVAAEGEKDEELFQKYMCYCKTGVADLEKSIAAAEAKASGNAAASEGAAGAQAQLEADLTAAKSDRSAAKKALADAQSLRDKEAGAYASFKSEQETNIAALNKAVAALEAGSGAVFLQSNTAGKLRDLVVSKNMADTDRETVVSFLSGEETEASTGEIIGILKQLGDEMNKDLSDATAAEESSIANFDELSAAKTKEVDALTMSIEEKSERLGQLGVSLAEMKGEGGDNADSLEDDKKFLADLKKGCGTKEAEYEEIKKMRAEELVALADTIKMLNDDDALELFKKTLPSAASSFMQVTSTMASTRSRALEAVRAAQAKGKHSPQLDFIALALHGKKMGFDKVIAMIDEMCGVLKAEQAEDDKKKSYCEAEFDKSEDEKKALERSVEDAEKAIEDSKQTISATKDEIKALADGIKELDSSVEEATTQRQEENAAFKELMAGNGAAKELLLKAKNRLNKFYNPKLAKFVQVKAHQQDGAEPGPAPEAPAAFKKKGEESNGVIALMDGLVKDLDKETTTAEVEEKDAQADYETAMADSKKKRADDTKTLEDKNSPLANAEEALQNNKDNKASATDELMGVDKYISSLHGECDFLMQYYTQRKEARDGEIGAMEKAKDVLNGADYSLLQVSHRHSLRGNRK